MDQEEKSLDPWMLLGDLGNIVGELADYFLSLSLLQQGRVCLFISSLYSNFPGTSYRRGQCFGQSESGSFHH